MLTPEQKDTVMARIDIARMELTRAAEILAANDYVNEAADLLYYAQRMAEKVALVDRTIPTSAHGTDL